MPPDRGKNVPLEAVRGCAAICVLFWHCLVAFFPAQSGLFPDKWPPGLTIPGRFWSFLFNGSAAVILFFVLSAYVLTRRYLLGGDTAIVTRGVVKRWPRLAGPALLAVLFSWLLFAIGAYRFHEAGDLVGSPWLSLFGFGGVFTPRLADAVYQGLFAAFFAGQHDYDSSLWTMRYELIGSLAAFGAAVVVRPILLANRLVALAVLAMIAALCHFVSPWYVAFPAGVALAAVLPARPQTLQWSILIPSLAITLYLFGAAESAYVDIFSSVILIMTIECATPRARRLISGPVSVFIGQLSFPLYLIHVPILCSVGAAAYLWAAGGTPSFQASLFAAFVTVVAAIFAALPLVVFNNWWVRVVDDLTRRALGQSDARRHASTADATVSAGATD